MLSSYLISVKIIHDCMLNITKSNVNSIMYITYNVFINVNKTRKILKIMNRLKAFESCYYIYIYLCILYSLLRFICVYLIVTMNQTISIWSNLDCWLVCHVAKHVYIYIYVCMLCIIISFEVSFYCFYLFYL